MTAEKLKQISSHYWLVLKWLTVIFVAYLYMLLAVFLTLAVIAYYT